MTPAARQMSRDEYLRRFHALPPTIRDHIQERRQREGLEPHPLPGEAPHPPPTPPVAPGPLSPAEAATAWNALLRRYREEQRTLALTRKELGPGPELEAVEATLAALRVEGTGLKAKVEAALGRALTDDEQRRGIQA